MTILAVVTVVIRQVTSALLGVQPPVVVEGVVIVNPDMYTEIAVLTTTLAELGRIGEHRTASRHATVGGQIDDQNVTAVAQT
jgi:hypothetical protein